MKEEQKQLLLKDFCARLPYGVMVENILNHKIFDLSKYLHCLPAALENFKPYLRPMSGMTEEEKQYIKNRWCYEDWEDICDFLNHYQIDAGDTYAFTDWLNEHHFDYRGLIEMGLALEAPEDMYKED